MVFKLSKKIKERVAKAYGFERGLLGTRWNYAMLIVHRTKKQIEMYEEVIKILDKLLEERWKEK